MMFDWTKFSRTTRAVKLHIVLDHDGYLRCFAHIADGTIYDVNSLNNHMIGQFSFYPDSIVVDDRGCPDTLDN
jgi:hypothetical protein